MSIDLAQMQDDPKLLCTYLVLQMRRALCKDAELDLLTRLWRSEEAEDESLLGEDKRAGWLMKPRKQHLDSVKIYSDR